MPKRYSPNLKKESAEEVEKLLVTLSQPSYVKLVSMIDARIKVEGKYSGREYLFNGAGSVVDVDERDVEWLLEKRQGERQCCGGSGGGNVVFTLVKE